MTSSDNTNSPEGFSEKPTPNVVSPAAAVAKVTGGVDEAYGAARSFPPIGLLLQPRFLMTTIGHFVHNWFLTRPLHLLTRGLPAVVIGLTAIFGWFTLRSATNQPQYVANYEQALRTAVKAEDLRGQEVALNSLLQFQPDSNPHRFNLALLRIKQDRGANAIATMRSLADDAAYTPARLWMADNLLSVPQPKRMQEAVRYLNSILKTDGRNLRANLMLAQVYMGLNEPMLAEQFLRTAAETDPTYQIQLANCLRQLGRNEQADNTALQAEERLRSDVAREPGDAKLRVRWAESLRMQGRIGEAQAALVQGLSISDDPELRRALARLITITATDERRRGASDTDRYLGLLLQALKYDPQSLSIITQIAGLPLEPNRIDAATIDSIQTFLDERLAKQADSEQLKLLRAWTSRMQGDNDAAIATLQKVVQSNPDMGLSLAQLYRLAEKPDLATQQAKQTFEHFRKKRDTDPGNHVNHVQLAQTYEFLGEYSNAIETIDTAQKANPHPELAARQIRFRLVHFDNLNRQGTDPEQQLKIVDQILEFDSANVQAINCLAQLMRPVTNGTDPEDATAKKARERLYDLLETGKNAFRVHSLLGVTAQVTDDFTTAAQHLDQAVRLKPDDPVVCNNLAYVLVNLDDGLQKDHERALVLANRALLKLPGNPEILETRGAVFVKLGRHADAIADLQQCLGKSGDVRDVHRYLAAAYGGLGNTELADRHRVRSEAKVPTADAAAPDESTDSDK